MWTKTAPSEPGFYWYRESPTKKPEIVISHKAHWFKKFDLNEVEFNGGFMTIEGEFYSERIKQPVKTVATFDVVKYCAERDTAMRIATSKKKIMMEGVK